MSDTTLGPGASMGSGDGKSRVRIVTDSSADIIPGHAHRLGIILVPSRIIVGDQVLRDGVDITTAQFYARYGQMRSGIHTVAAPPEDLMLAYRAALQWGATEVLALHISKFLSKYIQNASIAREQMPGAPIEIVDTLQVGVGMWPAVTAAAQAARQGKSISEIRAIVDSVLARTFIYFVVESLDALRRSGRVPLSRAVLAAALDAHPILTVQDGKIETLSTARPMTRAIAQMTDIALGNGEIESAILSGTSIESIAQAEVQVGQRYSGPLQKTWLGASLGVNIGPAIGLAVVVRDPNARMTSSNLGASLP